jgi:hypothetical protein
MAENNTDSGAQQSLLGGPEPQGAETQSGSLLGGDAPAEQQGGQNTQTPEPQGAEPAKNLDAATQYEKFTIPEGFEYDDGKVSEFTTLARELNLSQEQAQKLVDLHVRHWLGFEEQTRAQAEEWRKQTMNDPEFGGQKFMQSLQDAHRFVSAFGGEKLRIALDATGAGNHPEIFKAFALAGRLLGEDRLVKGAGAAPAGGGTFADLANTLYPDMKNGGNG